MFILRSGKGNFLSKDMVVDGLEGRLNGGILNEQNEAGEEPTGFLLSESSPHGKWD